MPNSRLYTLAWSSSHQAYQLYEGQEDEEALELVPEDLVRLVGVSQVASFAFHGKNGSYTARKEHRRHGEGYWYAYVRVKGKLTKRYLGRSTDVTLVRLEEIAQELWLDPQATLWQEEERALPALSGLSPVSLLATKLSIPRPRPHLVHRPRLVQRLQEGLERDLILLSAPAGFGKSTLLADWLASSALPVAWLSLEPQDNEPVRFLSYLIAALQTYDPSLGRAAQALSHPLQLPPLERVLTLLINDLQVWRTDVQEQLVLVLDNYHVITVSSIHHALSFLLDHLPLQLHIVLATREDPPLPLTRLRGRDALLELRAADLQFTYEETTTFLVEVMGLPLSAEESALLHARTEGWITGLHLAALSLLIHDDQSGFITAFTGSNHYVVDYLVQEVLSRQDKAIQDFLMQTSILDRLSGPLCDAVCARQGSQALLNSLEQANLFLVALDDERYWYRYHRLFAQVLYQRLQHTAPALIPELHLRASRWYEQHGFFTEAVSRALAASAFEEAACLIKQYIWTFVFGGQMQTICGWLQALPEPLVLASPSLCLIHAFALMCINQPEAASARLQMVERELTLGEDPQNAQRHLLLGQMFACWSLLARLSGDLEHCVSFSQQALDLLSETDSTSFTRLLRVEALLGATHAYLVSGNVTSPSEHLLARTIAFARTSSDHRLLLLRELVLLARLQVLQGRLHQASATYEEVAQLVKRSEEVQVLADSAAYSFGLGDLLREWNDLEAADHHLVQGMDLISGMVPIDVNMLWQGYAVLARLRQAQGKYEQALATLDTFLSLSQEHHVAPILVAQCATLRTQMQLARGDLQAARHWAASSGLSANDVLSYLREREYLTLARVHIAEGRISPTNTDLSEVLFLLERLLAKAEADMRIQSVLEILLLRALAFEVQGNHVGALVTLEHTLVRAEPEGYIHLFLDEGPPMLSLLRQAQRHGLVQGYVAKLLEAASKTRLTTSHSQAPQAGALLKPITARERAVLQLLLEGASNREIADQLIVSVNTVKKHISNICHKLNVQSRAQVIVRARRLRLM